MGKQEGATVDLNAVLEELAALGVDAIIECTGGNCASLLAGGFDTSVGTYAVIAGPAWFAEAEPEATVPPVRAWAEEFTYGRDGHGEAREFSALDPKTIAREIADLAAQAEAGLS